MTKPKMASPDLPKVKSAEIAGMVTFHCVVPREGKMASALYAKRHDYFVGRAIPKDYKPTKILSIEFDFINIWSLTEYKKILADIRASELCIGRTLHKPFVRTCLSIMELAHLAKEMGL